MSTSTRKAGDPLAPSLASSGTPSGPTHAWDADARADGREAISLLDALRIARATIAELTELPIDGIASSEPESDGGWRIVVDVVESAARMGENDLLAAHEVRLAPDGAPRGFARLRRYRREEAENR